MEPVQAPINVELPSGVYRHYKGNHYLVLGVARHSESMEPHVVYVRLYAREGAPMWIRPLEMFLGNVLDGDGKTVRRFTPIGADQPA